jgi:hypothetical protein
MTPCTRILILSDFATRAWSLLLPMRLMGMHENGSGLTVDVRYLIPQLVSIFVPAIAGVYPATLAMPWPL